MAPSERARAGGRARRNRIVRPVVPRTLSQGGSQMLASIVSRRSLLALIAVALLGLPAARANDERSAWVGTWATGPAGPGWPAPRFNHQKWCYIVFTNVAGHNAQTR